MNDDIDHAAVQGEAELAETVPHLQYLKMLVSILTLTMVLGIVAIVVILWTKLNARPLPELPASIILPEGAEPEAVTFGRDRLIVVTDQGEVLVFGADGGLEQQIEIVRP